MKGNVWSPRERKEYTAKESNGTLTGIGSLSIFEGRPGLWNLVWLHSVRVDTLLKWDAPAKMAPAYSAAIAACEESANEVIGGVTAEFAAANMKCQEFISFLKRNNTNLPIQQYWDRLEGDSWDSLVADRLELSRDYIQREGNVLTPNFS